MPSVEVIVSGESHNRIPFWVKLLYSAFVAVLVPLYWRTYGPWNFLYFCDIALLVTGAALWIEHRLLISMQAVAILLPQMFWVLDLVARLIAGIEITGVTAYMLQPSIPLYLRSLSLFHGWLPFFLLWLLWRLGYDRRALLLQSVVAVLVLLVSYFFAPAPPPSPLDPNRAVNINYVYGFTDAQPQALMAPGLWLAAVMAINIVGFYVPTDLVLRRMFGQEKAIGIRQQATVAEHE